MHALHVIKGLGPGGAERLLVSMAAVRSPHLQFSVAYLVPAKDHLVPELVDLGVAVHRLAGRRGMGDPRWPFRLRRLVSQVQPDVVHLHSPAVASIARLTLRVGRPRPLIFSTEHNEWPSFGFPTRTANALTRAFSDVHLAVSNEVRASMSARHAERTEVLVHGIPLDSIASRADEREDARKDLGISDDEIVVTIVANFREQKDYPTLLRAAAEASAAEPRLRFISVGQGPLESALRSERDRLGLQHVFHFLGYHPDPPRILAASDVFTLTSRYEGLSIALLEALAIGLPVVVSSVGGMKSVMTDLRGARLVPAGDVHGFVRAYVELARDPRLRDQMSRSSAAHARRFDITAAQRWLEERYRNELGRGRPEGSPLS